MRPHLLQAPKGTSVCICVYVQITKCKCYGYVSVISRNSTHHIIYANIVEIKLRLTLTKEAEDAMRTIE